MLTNSIKKINKLDSVKEYERKKRQKRFNLKLLTKINLNYLPRQSELCLSSKFVACPLKNNIYGSKTRYRRSKIQPQSKKKVDNLLGIREENIYEEENDNDDSDIYSLININDIYHQNTTGNKSLINNLNNEPKQGLAYDLKYKYGISLNHTDPITAVTMSASVVDSCSFFISCSRSKIIISLLNVNHLQLIHEEEIETGFGEVDWVTIDKSDQWIVIGVDKDIYVIEWNTLKIIKLEGHKERVTNVLFFYTIADPSQDYQSCLCLLSLSEDRTFIIWDFQNESCIYQSEILSPLPLTSVVIDQNRCRVIIGGADGRLRFFDLNTLRTKMICEPRCIHITDLANYWRDTVDQDLDDLAKNNNKSEGKAIDINVVSSLPKWRMNIKDDGYNLKENKKEDNYSIDYGNENGIINIHFLPHTFSVKKNILHSKFLDTEESKKNNTTSSSSLDKVKTKSSYLLVGMSQGIIILDSDNYNILYHYNLHEIPLSRVLGGGKENSNHNQEPREYSMKLVDGYHFFNFSNTTLMLWSHRFNQTIDIVELSQGQDTVKQDQLKFTEEEVDELCKDYLHNKMDFPELMYKVTEKNVKGYWSRNVYNDIIDEFNSMGITTVEQIKDHIEADFNPKIPKFIVSFIKYFLERLKLMKKTLISGLDSFSSPSAPLFSSENINSVVPTSLYASQSGKIAPDSPLKWAFLENKLKDGKIKKKTTIGGLGVLDVMNQPITFHSHVKSSGYSSLPTSLAYAKNFSKSKTKKVTRRPSSASCRTSSSSSSSSSSSTTSKSLGRSSKEITQVCRSLSSLSMKSTKSLPEIKPKDQKKLVDLPQPVMNGKGQCKGVFKCRIKYNPDCIQQTGSLTSVVYNYNGNYIASASTNGSACIYKYKLKSKSSEKEGASLYDWNWKYSRELIGHNNTITNVRWGSKCNHEMNKLLGGETQLLITSSKDNTARLWSLNRTDPLLVFKYVHGTPKSHQLHSKTLPHGSIFTYEIKDASLFYQNHFIALLHHNKLYFYRYLIQKQEAGSVKPHQNNNKYKITTSYTTDAQYFTAFSCINNNLSHLLLTASSDKSNDKHIKIYLLFVELLEKYMLFPLILKED
ncbi:hypothetical protein PIROE2DRAFT_58416 [Piromyces sp. E2]|nr:hypothetical protein PIROE2DRAFT_58416 [Piromyces sp. E2]|eukprot:OUM67913.1 hypothetical protein PIROE2DRAFT_58416 [Piromyces sp. E2]